MCNMIVYWINKDVCVKYSTLCVRKTRVGVKKLFMAVDFICFTKTGLLYLIIEVNPEDKPVEK